MTKEHGMIKTKVKNTNDRITQRLPVRIVTSRKNHELIHSQKNKTLMNERFDAQHPALFTTNNVSQNINAHTKIYYDILDCATNLIKKYLDPEWVINIWAESGDISLLIIDDLGNRVTHILGIPRLEILACASIICKFINCGTLSCIIGKYNYTAWCNKVDILCAGYNYISSARIHTYVARISDFNKYIKVTECDIDGVCVVGICASEEGFSTKWVITNKIDFFNDIEYAITIGPVHINNIIENSYVLDLIPKHNMHFQHIKSSCSTFLQR